MERLIWASSSVASLNPDSSVNPAAPMIAFWTLIRLNSPSPSCPTTDRASHLTRPPSIRTTIPGEPASSEASRSPLVSTVSPLHPPCALRRRATARAVVLASMTMLSPSWISSTAAAPMAAFSSCRSRSRISKASSGALRSGTIAPPWVRTTRPSASRATRSLRIVTAETPNRCARSLTRARPCSSTIRAIRSWRSRAKTSPRSLASGTCRASQLADRGAGRVSIGVSAHHMANENVMSRKQVEIIRNLCQAVPGGFPATPRTGYSQSPGSRSVRRPPVVSPPPMPPGPEGGSGSHGAGSHTIRWDIHRRRRPA